MDFKSVKALRLVSKAMNDLAEQFAFASITINFGPVLPERVPSVEHQLSTLASGNSPATRWAKSLTILNIEPVVFALVVAVPARIGVPTPVPSVTSRPGAFQREELMKTLHACRDRFLIPAIQALRSVQSASYAILHCFCLIMPC